jgi:D-3-phosphoglycerate dehydrogenase / 2-oxoglutarate reductase
VSETNCALVTARVDRALIGSSAKDWELRILRKDTEPYLPLSADAIIDALDGCRAWICEIDEVSAAILEARPELQLVVSCRGNPVNVDVVAATARGVMVCNTPARNADATADFAVGMIIAGVRYISTSERWLRSGHWKGEGNLSSYERFKGYDLKGKRIAIIGCGAVGHRVATRCLAFGLEVHCYDSYIEVRDVNFIWHASLGETLQGADIVSLHLPLNPLTMGLMGDKQFECMKPGSIFVNTARAGLVDKPSFLQYLKSGHIARAAMDVFWDEPLADDDPLLEFADRLTLTPHIGGATTDVTRNHTQMALECLEALGHGGVPPNLINPRRSQRGSEGEDGLTSSAR